MTKRNKNQPELFPEDARLADEVKPRPAAYAKGFEAGKLGQPLSACPYELGIKKVRGKVKFSFTGEPVHKPPTPSRMAWIEGWEDGCLYVENMRRPDGKIDMAYRKPEEEANQ